MPHLNNKQNKNTNPIISRQDYHLTQSCPSEEKQTNKQTKTQHKSYPIEAYTNHWTNRGRAETKRKKEFNLLQRKNSAFLEAWEKQTSNTITLKNNEKADKYCTNEGTNQKHRIPDKYEIGKLPEKKIQNNDKINMIQNLENKMEKMQESVNKDLEELKNKHTETKNRITEIKNTLEGINSRISAAQ